MMKPFCVFLKFEGCNVNRRKERGKSCLLIDCYSLGNKKRSGEEESKEEVVAFITERFLPQTENNG